MTFMLMSCMSIKNTFREFNRFQSWGKASLHNLYLLGMDDLLATVSHLKPYCQRQHVGDGDGGDGDGDGNSDGQSP